MNTKAELQQLISRLPFTWMAAIEAALMGDAFGAPHEFKVGINIPNKRELAMVMPASYPKTFPAIPYGTWSDDGSQMLALLDTLVAENGLFSKEIFGERLLEWLDQGRYQAGGVVFDCGKQTRIALNAMARGDTPPVDESRCGNGSLMRVLPVAALPDAYGIEPRDALLVSMNQSDLTHPQRLARVSCALYVQLAWFAQSGRKGMQALLPEAGQALIEHEVLTAAEQASLADILSYGASNMPNNSGYVVNSLWSALWAIDRSNSLSDTAQNVVCLGGDTDSISCIATGLASLIFGWDETAQEWSRLMWQRIDA